MKSFGHEGRRLLGAIVFALASLWLLLAPAAAPAAVLNYTQTVLPAYLDSKLPPSNPPPYWSGVVPRAAAFADLDGNGTVDLVVSTEGNSSAWAPGTIANIVVYDGAADGTLTRSWASYWMAGQYGTIDSLAIGDLNKDGRPDIAFPVNDFNGDGVFASFSFGNGDKTFGEPPPSLDPGGSLISVNQVLVRDVNHDGWPDLVALHRNDNYWGLGVATEHVSVFLNYEGAYTSTPDFEADTHAVAGNLGDVLALAEFGGDGNADLLLLDISDTNPRGLDFLKGRSDGTFDDAVTKVDIANIPAALLQFAVVAAAADTDGDGCNDFLVGTTTGSVWRFKGHCNDTFDKPTEIVHGPYTGGGATGKMGKILVSDFDHDGRKDIAFLGSIYLQTSPGKFTRDTTLCDNVGRWRCGFLAFRDLNGDHVPDIVATNPDLNKISVFYSHAGTPTVVTITAGGHQSANINTDFPQVMRVHVTDGAGIPVSGAAISFVPPASGPSASLFAVSGTKTDPSGNYFASAHANSTVGCYEMQIQLNGTLVDNVFELCNTLPNHLYIQSGTPQHIVTNFPFAQPLVAQVLDGSMTPVPGIIVYFSAPASGPSAKLAVDFAGFATATNVVSAVTDANGLAQVFAASNSQVGTYSVAVTAPFFASTNGVYTLTNTPMPGAAAQVLLTPASQSAVIGSQYAVPMVAQIADSAGTSVFGTGDAITFVQANNPSGAPGVLMSTGNTPCANGTAGPLTVPASFQGQATIYACANGFAGPFALRAGVQSDPNIAGVQVTLTNLLPTAGAAAASGGTPQSTPVNTLFPQALQVRVLTAGGQPAPGLYVVFTPPASGASATLSATSVMTDQNGYASVAATANGQVGSYLVTATVYGAQVAAVDFALTNAAAMSATPVPTLSQWGLLALSVLFGLAAVRRWRA